MLTGGTTLRGDEPPAKVGSFAALVASVGKPPAAEKISAPEATRLAYCVSEEALKIRQAAVLEKAGDIVLDNKPSGKQSLRVVLARLMRDPQDALAWKNVEVVAPFDGKSAHFTKIMLAYLYGKYRGTLPLGMLDILRQQAEAYEEFLGTGKENHISMQRVSGSIFGAAFPQMKTTYGITG
jgi:hypothetical protein